MKGQGFPRNFPHQFSELRFWAQGGHRFLRPHCDLTGIMANYFRLVTHSDDLPSLVFSHFSLV